MNTTPTQLTAQEVYRRFVLQVYRFHLARRGNNREAEQLTRATFKSIFLSTHFDPPPDFDFFRLSLFRAAVRKQATARHGRNSDNLAEGDPNETQSILFLRARLSTLPEYWAVLSDWQADAMALASFCDLDSQVISQALRREKGEIKTVLNAQANMLAELAGLATQVLPPEDFTAGLEKELENLTDRGNRSLAHRISGLTNRLDWMAGLSGLASRKIGQVSIGGVLLVVLLAFGLWSFFHLPTRPGTLALAAQATGANPTSTDSSQNTGLDIYQPDPGLLVPPDQATCLNWQTALSELTKASTPLSMIDNAPIDDPTTSGAEGAGYGCFVNLTSTSNNARVSLTNIQNYLTSQGFKRVSSVNANCPTPPPSSSLYNFTNGCSPSSSATWVNTKVSPNQRVIVEISGGRPFGQSSFFGRTIPQTTPVPIGTPDLVVPGVPMGTVSPAPDTARSPFGTPAGPSMDSSTGPLAAQANPWANQCMRYYTDGPCDPPGQVQTRRGPTIRIGIATDQIRPVIDNFLNQWAFGQSSTIDLLSSDLRASLPDLESMDHAANITRRPDLGVKITWQTIENSGHQVRLRFTIDQTSTLALPSHQSGPFQVVFGLINQKWQVVSLGQAPAQQNAN